MGLRTWTQAAVEDGGTLRWLVGLSIKLLVEFLVAAAFALVGTAALFLLVSPEVVRTVFGSNAFEVAWLSTSVGLFLGYTRYRFTTGTGE